MLCNKDRLPYSESIETTENALKGLMLLLPNAVMLFKTTFTSSGRVHVFTLKQV